MTKRGRQGTPKEMQHAAFPRRLASSGTWPGLLPPVECSCLVKACHTAPRLALFSLVLFKSIKRLRNTHNNQKLRKTVKTFHRHLWNDTLVGGTFPWLMTSTAVNTFGCYCKSAAKSKLSLLFDKIVVLYVSMCSEHHKVIVIQRRPVGRKMANDHVCWVCAQACMITLPSTCSHISPCDASSSHPVGTGTAPSRISTIENTTVDFSASARKFLKKSAYLVFASTIKYFRRCQSAMCSAWVALWGTGAQSRRMWEVSNLAKGLQRKISQLRNTGTITEMLIDVCWPYK